jgi:hypothetical protein
LGKDIVTAKAAKGREKTSPGIADVSATPVRPGPWDAPWHRKEDSTGWETVYRGTGQRREVRNILALELTPEQWSWLDHRARDGRHTPHAVVKQLIDNARAAEASAPEESIEAGDERAKK